MLKLILGRAGTGKTTAVLRRLCQAGAERPQVLIVPEQQSHEAERALCRMGGDGVSRYAEVPTGCFRLPADWGNRSWTAADGCC